MIADTEFEPASEHDTLSDVTGVTDQVFLILGSPLKKNRYYLSKSC